MKYNPGDRVICIKTMKHVKAGDRGFVVGAMDNYSCVRFERDDKNNYWVENENIVPETAYTPECSTRHVVFEITDNGGTAKYVDGKKTVRAAEIHRAGSDAPNDYIAMIWLLSKLFPCELRIEPADGRDPEFTAECACAPKDYEDLPTAPGFVIVTDYEGTTNILGISQITRIMPSAGNTDYSSIIELTDGTTVCCIETAAEIMEMIREDC